MCRVPCALHEQTLAPSDANKPPPVIGPFISPQRDAAAAPHFIAECFFLTQRAVHACLIPAGGSAHVPVIATCRACSAAASFTVCAEVLVSLSWLAAIVWHHVVTPAM